MGEVIAVFKIMPDSPESFEKLKSAVEALKPNRIEEEPVAYGLKAVKATFIIPDEGGKMDELENRLNEIEGTDSVETIHVSRSM